MCVKGCASSPMRGRLLGCRNLEKREVLAEQTAQLCSPVTSVTSQGICETREKQGESLFLSLSPTPLSFSILHITVLCSSPNFQTEKHAQFPVGQVLEEKDSG